MVRVSRQRPLKERVEIVVYTAAQRCFKRVGPARMTGTVADGTDACPRLVVTCVYRRENDQHVLRLLSGIEENTDIRLWALDRVSPRLLKWTLGSGPGSRFALHERLLDARPVEVDRTWILTDDDIDLGNSSLLGLAHLAERAGFDVFGPVHGPQSNFSHTINMQRPLLVARECDFVEIGPVVGFSPAARQRLVPFHDSSGLGWGMEAVWASTRQEGMRLGVVDAQPLRHLGTVGQAYDKSPERTRNDRLLVDHGVQNRAELFRVRNRWWRWQQTPPWVSR